MQHSMNLHKPVRIFYVRNGKSKKVLVIFNAIIFENIVKNLWAIIEDIDEDRRSGEKKSLRSFQNFTQENETFCEVFAIFS